VRTIDLMRVAVVALLATGCGGPSRARPPNDAPPQGDAAPDAAPSTTPDPIAALAQMPPVCSSSGWCWLEPKPIGTRWTGSFASSSSNLWLTAAPSYLFRWDGNTWSSLTPPDIPPEYLPYFRNDVDIITGSSPTDMWFVMATGTLAYHYDGTAFTLLASIPPPAETDGFLSGVWEAPDTDDRWLCADHELFHTHGNTPFTQLAEPAADPGCNSIWGVAHDDFWITESGVPYHYDGQTFTLSQSPPIGGLAGTAANDIWAIGINQIVHYDGTSWTAVQPTDANALVTIAGGLAPHDVWFLANRTAPHSYTLHWDGTAFTRYDQPLVEQPTSSQSTYLDSRLLVPAESGAFYEMQPTNPLLVPALHATSQGYNQIWPDIDGTFWVAGIGAVFHVDEHDQVNYESTGMTLNMSSISGARMQDLVEIIAVGQNGTIKRFDGASWTSTSVASAWLDGVWVARPGLALAVGANGTAFRWDGTTFTPIATGVTTELYGVWGPDPDHAYAVGAGGVILAWSSATPDVMTPVASPTTTELRAITGAGGKVWLAGDRLWQGDFTNGFTDVSPASGCCSYLFRSLFAVSATDVYAGSQKVAYHSSGGAFADIGLGLDVGTGVAIAVSATGKALAGTALGALLEHP
jgi:hypothetical protein